MLCATSSSHDSPPPEAVHDAEEERLKNRGIVSSVIDWLFPGMIRTVTQTQVLDKLDNDMMKGMKQELDDMIEAEANAIQAGLTVETNGLESGGPLDQAGNSIWSTVKSWVTWSRR